MRVRTIGLRHVIALMALSLYAATPAFGQGPPPANVVLDAVKQETLAQQREVTGNIRSRFRAQLAAQEEGIVRSLDLDAGDRVEAGQVIAKLDDTLAQLAVDRSVAMVAAAEALIKQREAQLEDANRDLARLNELDQGGSASVSELDQARIRVQTAEAQLAAAVAAKAEQDADLAAAQKRHADMTITAPFAGRVVAKQTEVGQWLRTGDAVVTILSVEELEAWIDVPERVVGLLSEETAVAVHVRATDSWIDATLARIVPEADELSRLYPVRLRVPNESGALKPGMSLIAMVPTSDLAPTITVHKDAVLRNEVGEYVYFAAPAGEGPDGSVAYTAQMAPIQRLFVVGDRVAVRTPVLQPGMLLVVQGNERMFPTQPLNVLDVRGATPVAGGEPAAEGNG